MSVSVEIISVGTEAVFSGQASARVAQNGQLTTDN